MTSELKSIPLSSLHPDPHQVRQHFGEEAMAELVLSVKAQGVLEPLIVRPFGKGFQVVAGERRLRAAKEAGLGEVPCLVRSLAEKEAREIQLTENLQREDVHPSDEAAIFKRLIESGDYTVATLAERIGKSPQLVYQRLRLLKIEPAVADAVALGHVLPSVVPMLESLGSKDQVQVLKVLLPDGVRVGAKDTGNPAQKSLFKPLTARQCKERIAAWRKEQGVAAKKRERGKEAKRKADDEAAREVAAALQVKEGQFRAKLGAALREAVKSKSLVELLALVLRNQYGLKRSPSESEMAAFLVLDDERGWEAVNPYRLGAKGLYADLLGDDVAPLVKEWEAFREEQKKARGW